VNFGITDVQHEGRAQIKGVSRLSLLKGNRPLPGSCDCLGRQKTTSPAIVMGPKRRAIPSGNYPRDFSGQGKALSDARAESHPPIRVEPLDIAPVRRLFLVSPTWLFRPAPPLWVYVQQADRSGKDVVLVMTGNSRYKQQEIDVFARRVEAHGVRLSRHIFLRRGRIFWQKSREELLKEVRAEMEALR
jgi:hypothetical protein